MSRVILAATALGLGAVVSSAAAQNGLLQQPAQLEVRSAPLEVALVRLEQGSGVPIAFSNDLVRGVTVSCSCAGATVAQALDSLLAGTPLEYLVMGRRVVVRLRRGAGPGVGSGRAIVGVVRSATDGRPISTATVGFGDGIGTTRTDARGRFRLPMGPGPANRELVARAIGYRPVRLDSMSLLTGPADTVAITLAPAPIRLADIVVMPSTYGILTDPAVVPTHTLSREDVQTRPHLGEDVFRAVDRLPGVATNDITARFEVRGGPNDQVLMTLDGLELYEPYHLKDADAALSIIDVESVGNIDLIAGGFSAEYGDKLTGVFAMETAAPPPGRTATTLGLSVQNLAFKNQGHFADGRGNWLVSARRGYLDLILDLTNAPNEGAKFSPTYYDVFTKIQRVIGSAHRLSAEALWAGDNVSVLEEDGTKLESAWSSGYAWVTWDADFTDAVQAQTIASVGRVTRNRIGSDVDTGADITILGVDDRQVFEFAGVKQDWRWLTSDDVMFKWGIDLKHGRSDYDYTRWSRAWIPNTTDPLEPAWSLAPPETLALQLAPLGEEVGAYAAGRFRPWAPVTFETGLRYDYHSHTGDHTLAPRLNAAVQLGPRNTIRSAWGYYYQAHGLHELRVADGESEFGQVQRAEHRIIGLEHELGGGVSLRIEAYERRVNDPLPEYRSLVPEIETVPEEGPEDRVRIEPTRIIARGIEVSATYDRGGPVKGTVRYALASARDEVDGTWSRRPYDQRHTVHVELSYRPDTRWSMSGAWQYHSPWPATSEAYAFVPLASGGNAIMRQFGTPYGDRMPAYHRLDLRVQRHFPLGRGRISVFLDVFNVYDRENVLAWDYAAAVDRNGSGLDVQRNVHAMIGVLPTAGVRWQF